MTALELAAALLTPDSDLLPAVPRASVWTDRRDRVWLESEWPGWLRMVDDDSGRVLPARWPAFMAQAYHGPLREVTP